MFCFLNWNAYSLPNFLNLSWLDWRTVSALCLMPSSTLTTGSKHCGLLAQQLASVPHLLFRCRLCSQNPVFVFNFLFHFYVSLLLQTGQVPTIISLRWDSSLTINEYRMSKHLTPVGQQEDLSLITLIYKWYYMALVMGNINIHLLGNSASFTREYLSGLKLILVWVGFGTAPGCNIHIQFRFPELLWPSPADGSKIFYFLKRHHILISTICAW